MQAGDFQGFSEVLEAVLDLYGKPISGMATQVWWEALKPYELPAVRQALSRHVQDPERGQFVPKPADVIRVLTAGLPADRRPGADEAWAVAIASADESATVVWTEEIAQAFGIASPILEAGDKIGARMAFRDAYDRLVLQARDRGTPCVWAVSLGTDERGRSAAITAAVDAGRLSVEKARSYLPAPEVGGMIGALISGDQKALLGYAQAEPSARRGIAMVLAKQRECEAKAKEIQAHREAIAAAERVRFEESKARTMADVERIQAERSEGDAA
jgi:hypothetical protein